MEFPEDRYQDFSELRHRVWLPNDSPAIRRLFAGASSLSAPENDKSHAARHGAL